MFNSNSFNVMSEYVQITAANKEMMEDFVSHLLYDIRKNGATANGAMLTLGAFLYLNKYSSLLPVKVANVQNKKQYYDELISCVNNTDMPLREEVTAILCSSACEFDEFTVFSMALELIEGRCRFNDGEALYWYDYCISKIEDVQPGKECMMSVPRELNLLADAFVCGDAKNVFVPFGYQLSLATALRGWESLDSFEIYESAWKVGMLRMALAGKLDGVNFINANIGHWPAKKYDAIVSFPPFGMKIEVMDENGCVQKEEAELLAVKHFVDSTTENGMCVSYMAPSMLASGSRSRYDFRKMAVEQGILDTVILLPRNILPGTSIQVACVILRKKPHLHGAVRVIDASNCYTSHLRRNIVEIGQVMQAYHDDVPEVSMSVPYDKIREYDYSWNVKEYLCPYVEQAPEGFRSVMLNDITKIADVQKDTKGPRAKTLKAADLSNDWTRPYVALDTIEADSKRLSSCYKLTEDALLVSTVTAFRPSIVKASEEAPVWLTRDITALVPGEGINWEYLCMCLAKAKTPFFGAAVPRFSQTQILRLSVLLPESLDAQHSLFVDNCRGEMLAKAKETGLLQLFDEFKASYMNEVRSRKHDMMPHLRQISSARKVMKLYMDRREEFSDSDFMSGMKEELDHQAYAIEHLTSLLKIFSREEQFGEPEVVNIDKFLIDNFFDGDNYDIDHDTDYRMLKEYGFDIPDAFFITGEDFLTKTRADIFSNMPDYAEGINVFMAKDDLQRLCENIISNAVRHGFTDPNRHDYGILTVLTVDAERDMFLIEFRNNGTPLPKGLDKTRYGLRGEKAGKTGGTGEGGYVVKSIVEHYHGDFDILMDGETTVVKVWIPIHIEND